MANGSVRWEIGFVGGSTTAGEVPESEWAKLEAGLAAGTGVVEMTASDQRWLIRVEQVVYAWRQGRGRGIGFTG
jgi:hypothetical protein